MLLYVALCFSVLALVDTAAIIACYALAALMYEYLFVGHPLAVWWFIVELAVGVLLAAAHRALHRKHLWSVVPLSTRQSATTAAAPSSSSSTTAHLLPIVVQQTWQRWSSQVARYVHESTNNVLVATLVFAIFVAFYRRRLDGNDFPIGVCLTVVMACGTLFTLDVFHYYDRETMMRRESAFNKADRAAEALLASRSVATSSLSLTRASADPTNAATATSADTNKAILIADLVVCELPVWQTVVSAAVVLGVVTFGLVRRFLEGE